MALRLGLVVVLLAVATAAMVAESMPMMSEGLGYALRRAQKCNGLVGDCIDVDEEMMMPSESTRRTLARQTRAISYAALSRNNVPCNRRGSSYYNCNSVGPAQPYRRQCTAATRCARRA